MLAVYAWLSRDPYVISKTNSLSNILTQTVYCQTCNPIPENNSDACMGKFGRADGRVLVLILLMFAGSRDDVGDTGLCSITYAWKARGPAP